MPSNLYAVIGNPIRHSLSPMIHQAFAKACHLSISYEKIQAEIARFEMTVLQFLTDRGKGLNITLPFKEQAFALAQQKKDRCLRAKAANTLWLEEGILWGDNTDGIGFVNAIVPHVDLSTSRILILGIGGASRGLLAELTRMPLPKITVAARDEAKLASFLIDFPSIEGIGFQNMDAHYDLIINATSAGIHQEALALPKDLLQKDVFFYDLSYDLTKSTPFISAARKHGANALDGLTMLVEQAAESFYIWHKERPNTKPVIADLEKLRKAF